MKSSSRATPKSSGAATARTFPAFIIKRLPVRLTFDNNYFNALYQGIPIGGYTKMIANLLDGIEVRLNTDYLENKAALDALADKVVYTGPIDAYFDYKLGTLEYRSSGLRMNCSTSPASRATPPSTTPTARPRGPASSSTNGSSSARTRTATTCPRRSSAASIPPSGSPAMNRTTPSTMPKTAHCMPSTKSSPR